jgi:hypothetical protein
VTARRAASARTTWRARRRQTRRLAADIGVGWAHFVKGERDIRRPCSRDRAGCCGVQPRARGRPRAALLAGDPEHPAERRPRDLTSRRATAIIAPSVEPKRHFVPSSSLSPSGGAMIVIGLAVNVAD